MPAISSLRASVDAAAAEVVIRAANDILAGKVLADALRILVVTQFPAADRIGNFFRKGAAVAGSPGAQLDARIVGADTAQWIVKARASAFANTELDATLRSHNISELYVLGVFAEGCVGATVVDATRRGYQVHVIADAVASRAAWKRRFALWAMKRAGAHVHWRS